MIGLVVTAHGRLAEELVATARQIVGELTQVTSCGVDPCGAPEQFKDKLREAIHSVDSGDGVIVLADLLGGSPCTSGLSLCSKANVEVLTGVNLPMLLKANSMRASASTSARELATALIAYAQKNITCASELLRARSSAA